MSAIKRQVFEALLPLCPFVAIRLDWPGLKLPMELLNLPETLPPNTLPGTVLRYGRDPDVMNMPDLEITDRGLSATLSMQGRRYDSIVPWGACASFHVGDPFRGPIVQWPFEDPPPERAPLRVV